MVHELPPPVGAAALAEAAEAPACTARTARSNRMRHGT